MRSGTKCDVAEVETIFQQESVERFMELERGTQFMPQMRYREK